MVILSQTDDYPKLKELFIENGLEMSSDDPTPDDLVKSFKLEDDGKLMGGIVIARRDGEFIIDGIAVDGAYREKEYGKKLLEKAVDEVKALNGESIYLVARAPNFFRKQGFNTVAHEGAPDFFECRGCPQFGVSCHPEVMKLNIKERGDLG